jgi:SAM-dependent methyltransferase
MFTERSVRIYDRLYAAQGRSYEREAEEVLALVQRLHPGAASLLDLCCGTGGHLPFFRRRFEQVAAVDLEPAMIEAVRRRGLDVECQVADMAEAELGRVFDVVVCLFSAIGYVRTLERFRQSIARIRAHLAPGGVALIEPWFTRQELLQDSVHALFLDDADLKAARINVTTLEEGVSVMTLHFLVAEGTRVESFVERHECGLFEREDYERAFAACGLELHHDPGGLRGRGMYVGRAL